jgi:hydroxyacylglutathione hydrolase
MARVVEINRGPLVTAAPAVQVVDAVHDGSVLLDVRPARAHAAGHVPGSLGVSADQSGFATRVGFLADLDDELVLLASDEREALSAASSLAAIGFTRLARLAEGAIPPERLGARFTPLTVAELAASPRFSIVDVREPDEQDFLAPGALAVPYRLLPEADLSALDPEAPTATICQSGARAAVAASLLEQRGFTDVRPVLGGGMDAWPLAAARAD